MKILHLCLASFYIDNYSYQENILPVINREDGHSVEIIASTETYIENQRIGYIEPGSYYTSENIKITRVPYRKYLPHVLMRKIRHYRYVYRLVADFSPDVILFHGLSAYDLLTVAKYKRRNPDTKLFVDSHADENNSASSWLSRNCLHRIIFRLIVRRAYRYIDRILYISIEAKEFLEKYYKLDNEKMEFFPLGCSLLDNEIRNEKRIKKREQLGLTERDILVVHSGKLDRNKRTEDLIAAFVKLDRENLNLIVIGSIPKDQAHIRKLIEEGDRIAYLGWINGDELLDYLCASDLYAQPGSQSVTMQSALCCGSAVMLYPYRSHKHLLGESVFYVESIDDITEVLDAVSKDRKLLEKKRSQSMDISMRTLDYRRLTERLYT